MAKILVFNLFFFLSIQLFSQGVNKSPSPEKLNKMFDKWHSGRIIFRNLDSLDCALSYSPLITGGLIKAKDSEDGFKLLARHQY